MSTGMKVWMGALVLSLALTTVSKLPPTGPGRNNAGHQRLPEEARLDELKRDARRTEEVLQRMRWADSLPTLAAASQSGGLAVAADPGVMAPDEIARTRAYLEDELARGQARSDVVIGYFVQPGAFGADPAYTTRPNSTSETYLGTLGGTPYCVRVHARLTATNSASEDLGLWTDAQGVRHSDALQTCRLAARYGLPGEKVGEWLRRGAATYARSGLPPSPQALERPWYEWFGMYRRNVEELDLRACLADRHDACARVVLNPADYDRDYQDLNFLSERSPVLQASPVNGFGSHFGQIGDYLLGDLEREFGPERFARFWTSDADVPAAFEDAFGTSIGAWTATWARTNVGKVRLGPTLPRAASVGTLVVLLLCGLAAGGFAMRRRVA